MIHVAAPPGIGWFTLPTRHSFDLQITFVVVQTQYKEHTFTIKTDLLGGLYFGHVGMCA
jgi:hypothetical protein